MLKDNVRQEIAEALFHRAVELYDHERADAIRSYLEQMAGHLWLLASQAPPREVEPGCFM